MRVRCGFLVLGSGECGLDFLPGAVPAEDVGDVAEAGLTQHARSHRRAVSPGAVDNGRRSRIELVKNMAIMGQSVAAFLPIWRIVSVTMSEYYVRSSHR